MLSKILMKISKRERIMLSAFVIVMLLLWLGQLSNSWEEVGNQLRETEVNLSGQRVWLDSADTFDRELRSVRARIDRSSTLNRAQLSDFLDGLGRERRLTYELSTPVTREGTLFRQNTLRVAYRNATLEQMLAVYDAIDQRKPYLSIDEITFTSNRADPRLLNVRLTLSSFELKESP